MLDLLTQALPNLKRKRGSIVNGNDEKKKKKERYTISDVADALGVSRATVSRAISNSPGVGEELRKRVLAYVKEIGYAPNTLAQSFSKGRMNFIALVLGDIRNPFYSELAFFIQKELNENGYMVMVFNSEYDEQKEIEYIRMAARFNFAGLILFTAQTKEIERELENLNIPKVLVNRMLDRYQGSSVLLDNFKAGYIAAMHLIELGHKKIGFIDGHTTSSASRQRFEGYKQALKNYGLECWNEDVMYSDLKMETGDRLAEEFIHRTGEKPSALIIVNDMTALGFLNRCKEEGIHVPKELSIVSFDDIIFSSMKDVELTTVSQHADEMSGHAVRLMLKQLKEKDGTPERIILDPTLIVRKTTGIYREI